MINLIYTAPDASAVISVTVPAAEHIKDRCYSLCPLVTQKAVKRATRAALVDLEGAGTVCRVNMYNRPDSVECKAMDGNESGLQSPTEA